MQIFGLVVIYAGFYVSFNVIWTFIHLTSLGNGSKQDVGQLSTVSRKVFFFLFQIDNKGRLLLSCDLLDGTDHQKDTAFELFSHWTSWLY